MLFGPLDNITFRTRSRVERIYNSQGRFHGPVCNTGLERHRGDIEDGRTRGLRTCPCCCWDCRNKEVNKVVLDSKRYPY